MADNCNPKYKNLNRIQSFSEQRYATVQLMQQACMNDEYLKQQVDELNYLSPAAVRKQFTPIDVDDTKSWGYQKNQDNTVSFNTSTSNYITVDFTDETMKYVDLENTTCDLYVNGESRVAQLHQHDTSTLNTNTRDWNAVSGVNEFWYVGYDKSKTYQSLPQWDDNVWDRNIPAVCRAETIKIDDISDNVEARLTGVVLKLQYGGSTTSKVQSPLYVQLRKTTSKQVERYNMEGEFSYKEFKFKSYNPKQYDTVYVPDGDPTKALATAVYYPNTASPANVTIPFDNPPVVEKGETYALVFASPLSHYDHAPRVGGWGRICNPDPYPNGYAWISEDNGYTWNRYGKDNYNVDYRFGRRWPRDFAFQCHIREFRKEFTTNAYEVLYLNPIYSNPIKSVQLSSHADRNNQEIIYEVSTTGYDDDWIDVTTTRFARFTPNEQGEYPRVLLVRAKLKSTDSGKTPSISNIILGLSTELPDEMHVRTHYYNPKTEPMLGANIWGRLYAPFTTEPSTDCTVEIISNKTHTENFKIIQPTDLVEYTYIKYPGTDNSVINASDVEGKNEGQLINFLTDHPEIVDELANNNIQVIGFIQPFKLSTSPAYPILGCYLTPSNPSIRAFNLGEFYEYNVDYDEDTLTFYEKTISDKLIPGNLKVEYNPVFIDNLTLSEVGRRVDDEGVISEGLVLDYFKEEFVITDKHIETRTIDLRVSPVDPIRSVILNKDTDDEEILTENVDYTVDPTAKKIVFEMVGDDGVSSRLNLGDKLSIVYTPSLEDSGISIGYHATRTDKNKEVYIEPNYIEYKV